MSKSSPSQAHLIALEIEHADLDAALRELSVLPHFDELRLRRMKSKKLKLKDSIAKLRSLLIPDLDA